ncbi:MAG: hypothetical protein H7839_19470 [Magnetococcus sp. YQC-5]
MWVRLLVLLLLLTGCFNESNDPVTMTLSASDTTLDVIEKIFRPESYWTKKVKVFEKTTSEARNQFEHYNQDYHAKLLMRRESVIQSVQDAKKLGKETKAARQEAFQAHREALAKSRDDAREAGKQLRQQLALLRRAQEFLDKAK